MLEEGFTSYDFNTQIVKKFKSFEEYSERQMIYRIQLRTDFDKVLDIYKGNPFKNKGEVLEAIRTRPLVELLSVNIKPRSNFLSRAIFESNEYLGPLIWRFENENTREFPFLYPSEKSFIITRMMTEKKKRSYVSRII